jgi:hypothetical protein
VRAIESSSEPVHSGTPDSRVMRRAPPARLAWGALSWRYPAPRSGEILPRLRLCPARSPSAPSNARPAGPRAVLVPRSGGAWSLTFLGAYRTSSDLLTGRASRCTMQNICARIYPPGLVARPRISNLACWPGRFALGSAREGRGLRDRHESTASNEWRGAHRTLATRYARAARATNVAARPWGASASCSAQRGERAACVLIPVSPAAGIADASLPQRTSPPMPLGPSGLSSPDPWFGVQALGHRWAWTGRAIRTGGGRSDVAAPLALLAHGAATTPPYQSHQPNGM